MATLGHEWAEEAADDAAGGGPSVFARALTRAEGWLEAERERIGLWLPVALATGIGAWFALPGPGQWIGWLAGCGALAVLALLLPMGGRLQKALVVVACAGAIGCVLIWAKALAVGGPPLARPAMAEFSARVIAVQPQPAREMTRLDVAIEPQRADLPPRVRINVADADWPKGLEQGARIAVKVRLMPPAPPAVPGAYDFAQTAWFAGIGATGRALPPVRVIEPAGEGARPLARRLFAHITDRLGTGGEGAIAAALATGDMGGISQADSDAMRASGLAHLLSISGLHVSAVIGAVMLLVRLLLGLSRRVALGAPVPLIAAGAGALAGIGYTVLTGSQVPTVRSCVAALLVLAALALGRQAISLRLVAAGALIVLLFWPEAVVGPSFQMSFLAVAALIALAETQWFARLTRRRDEGVAARGGRLLLGLLLTGVAVEAALMPVALYHFHKAGVLGALANLVAIPLTTFVIMPAEALALLLDAAGLGAPAWWVAGKALGLLLALAHFVAGRSYALWALPVFPGWALLLVLGGMLWLMLWGTRVRLAGVPVALLGMAAMMVAPAPDMLVTGDGHHVALRRADGTLALLRPRAGDYVRNAMSGSFGQADAVMGDGPAPAIADMREAVCSIDLCRLRIKRGGRRWELLLVRSRDRLPWGKFVAECARADVVIADRRLPRGCTPRWLKLDRALLAQRGGVALYLGSGRARFVRGAGDRHPWVGR